MGGAASSSDQTGHPYPDVAAALAAGTAPQEVDAYLAAAQARHEGEAKATYAELNEALQGLLPELAAADEGLRTVSKRDVSELKCFKSPPRLVQLAMEAVCVLLQAGGTDWPTVKKLTGRGDFLGRLRSFDKDNAPDAVLLRVHTYLDNELRLLD